MKIHKSFGDHKILKYDMYQSFQQYFKELFHTDQLDTLQTDVYDFDGSDTNLHKLFYGVGQRELLKYYLIPQVGAQFESNGQKSV